MWRVLLREQGKQHAPGHIDTRKPWVVPSPSPLRAVFTAPDAAPILPSPSVPSDIIKVVSLEPVALVVDSQPPVALTRSQLILARIASDSDTESESYYSDEEESFPTVPSASSIATVWDLSMERIHLPPVLHIRTLVAPTQSRILTGSQIGNLRRTTGVKGAVLKRPTPSSLSAPTGKRISTSKTKRMSVLREKENDHDVVRRSRPVCAC
jgi:hypothetical protein